MGLVAIELERAGVSTVALQLLHRAAAEAPPPRGLWVPFWHGYALGSPRDPAAQRTVLEAAFAMLEAADPRGPVLRDLEAPA